MVQVMRQYCPVCRADVTHMLDAWGAMRCVSCADRSGVPIAPAAPPVWQQQQRPIIVNARATGDGPVGLIVKIVFAVIGVGMCFYACNVVCNGDRQKRTATPSVTSSTPTPAGDPNDPWSASYQKPPAEAEPTFEATNTEKRERALADLAQRAIYKRCSTQRVWREGSVLDGTYVFRSKGQPEMVNVSVKLARLNEVANGNTLWYRVTFANGKPVSFRANKKISAELCDLPAPEVETPL